MSGLFSSMKDRVQKVLQQTRQTYKSLPDKKQYVEFFTTLLSVPVLLTVILLNVNNLRNTAKPTVTVAGATAPTPVKEIIYVNQPATNNAALVSNTSGKKTETPVVTPTGIPDACDKSIGPVSIKNPIEDEVISDDPVSVVINYDQGNHCAVVWAYKINGGRWSEYDDKSLALYNLPNGPVALEVKVKSIVSGEETLLSKNFTYLGKQVSDQSASNSAN